MGEYLDGSVLVEGPGGESPQSSSFVLRLLTLTLRSWNVLEM